MSNPGKDRMRCNMTSSMCICRKPYILKSFQAVLDIQKYVDEIHETSYDFY